MLETLKLYGRDPAAYLHAEILAADRGSVLLPGSSPLQLEPGGRERLPQMRRHVRTGAPRGLTDVLRQQPHAEAAAALFGVIASCRLHGLGLFRYLEEVLLASCRAGLTTGT